MIVRIFKNFKTGFVLMSILLIFVLAGCGSENVQTGTEGTGSTETDMGGVEKEDICPDTVTYLSITFDYPSYNVYVINPETIVHYDLTLYWTDARDGYDYFEDPLPPKEQFETRVYTTTENGWDEIRSSLNENKFNKLPEDLGAEDVMDGGFSYIEVLSGDDRYFSGGYCVSAGTGSKNKRFSEVETVIRDVITRSCEETEAAYVYIPEPVPAEFFAEINPELSWEDIISEIGFEHDICFSSGCYWCIWNLDDGRSAAVNFDDDEEEILKVRIISDDGFIILYDAHDHALENPDVKYEYVSEDDYSDEEYIFFELASLMTYADESGAFEDTESIEDYLAVSYLGESYDLTASDFENGCALRMSEKELKDFYSLTTGEENRSAAYGDTDYNLMSKGDGYAYAPCRIEFPAGYRVEFVSRNEDVYYIEGMIRDESLDLTIATVILHLTAADTKYGYEITDTEYIPTDYSRLIDEDYVHDLVSQEYFENADCSYALESVKSDIGHFNIRVTTLSELSWYGWYMGETTFWVLFDEDENIRQIRKECGGFYAIMYDSESGELANSGTLYDISDDDKFYDEFSVIEPEN